MLSTTINTLMCIYLIYIYLDKKIKINFYGIVSITLIIVIKPIIIGLLKDNFLVFIFVWFCIYIIVHFLSGKNIKRNLELSFFIELINLISYYMAAGIVITLTPSINIKDIFNFNIVLNNLSFLFISLQTTILIAFGMFRRFIPLNFFDDSNDEIDFSGIYLIMGINILIKVMNDLNLNYGTILILFVSINFFILIFYIINRKLNVEKIKAKLELNEKEKRISELTLYIDTIEGLVEKYKEFKHDYKNIIVGIGVENFKENDLFDKLKKEVVEDRSYDAFLNLKDIKYIPLKSLLSYYTMLSIKKNIEMNIVTIGEIKESHISEVEFSRVMGIILENAIEEAAENDKKKIEVYVETIDEKLNILVGNTFRSEMLNLKEIYIKGYSSKGENRGIGLYIVKSIVDKYPNMTLDTFINEDMFIQELYISPNQIE